MKYIVVECNFSYAVVLDEKGRYLKVANMHYEVGQTVTEVIEMQEVPTFERPIKKNAKWMYGFAAMAACLVLVTTMTLRMDQTRFASVYMRINPEVRIDVNRKDVVVSVEGMNDDGNRLIEGYSYKKKELDLVMDELVDLAIEMGFLSKGDEVTLTLEAEDGTWVVEKGETLKKHLNEYLEEKISVTIQVTETTKENQGITIPINPEDSDYGSSDYDTPTDEGDSTYDTPTDEGDSSYDAPIDEGDLGYDAPVDEGDSDYDTPTDEGDSSYDTPIDEEDSGYDVSEGDSDYGDN